MKISHGVLPRKQSGCDLDKVIGGLVVEIPSDRNGGRPCCSADCQGIRHGSSWGSVAELSLSARADGGRQQQALTAQVLISVAYPQGRGLETHLVELILIFGICR
jgi:hypothetical protein